MGAEASQGAAVSTEEAEALFAGLDAAGSFALAVSGGPDSMALMLLAAGWRLTRPSPPGVVVLTIDHGLRQGSAQEAEAVAGAARGLGLDHHILRWTGPKPSSNVQNAAREARYALMGECCRRLGIGHLLTAHHLDDQAETFLLRLARGSGVDGLAAMAPRSALSEDLILHRPLLGVPKDRLVATASAAGLPFVNDPSNRERRFARSRMRALMPALAAEGLTAARLAATAQRMARARAALEAATGDLQREAVSEGAGGARIVDRRRIAAAPEEIGLRLVARLLKDVAGCDLPPRLDRLERLYRALVAGEGSAPFSGATLGGCRFVPRGGEVAVAREGGRSAASRESAEA